MPRRPDPWGEHAAALGRARDNLAELVGLADGFLRHHPLGSQGTGAMAFLAMTARATAAELAPLAELVANKAGVETPDFGSLSSNKTPLLADYTPRLGCELPVEGTGNEVLGNINPPKGNNNAPLEHPQVDPPTPLSLGLRTSTGEKLEELPAPLDFLHDFPVLRGKLARAWTGGYLIAAGHLMADQLGVGRLDVGGKTGGRQAAVAKKLAEEVAAGQVQPKKDLLAALAEYLANDYHRRTGMSWARFQGALPELRNLVANRRSGQAGNNPTLLKAGLGYWKSGWPDGDYELPAVGDHR